ncbi:hypothetical protein FJW08_29830 [Mesorhizobium sp. B3-2-1]|uniref:hypothetical protein n=1 Tax=Mesorhizobium sp. B3-2-1 TaxID=2589891 RepID=UPI00112B27AD|nr:hypothetical protein [Mesorhizobium sp. B3-2-1]TPI24314.1 hypothetical protein FJW08_29830 [Mesorhizobium sp. B3-2-1]
MAMLLEDLNSILRHRKTLRIEQDQIVQKCIAPIVFPPPPRPARIGRAPTGKGDEDRFGQAAGFSRRISAPAVE